MSRVLVSGGAGYIGSHTAVELLSRGYDVVVADNFSNSHTTVLEQIKKLTGKLPKLYTLDLCDKASTDSMFEKERFDAVVHFAAFKSVGESVENPLKYYRNNLLSHVNVLDAAMRYGTGTLVFSSSCSVYGNPSHNPVTEATPIARAESPYAMTKQICERMLFDLGKTTSLRTIILRYFNPVGAHSSALIGELPLSRPDSLVPVITQTAAGKRDALVVFGSDYNTPDGTCIRDFIHITDIAVAHVRALEYMSGAKSYHEPLVFNLGTGHGVSILEAIRTFEKVSGMKLNYHFGPRREGDVVSIFADCTLANNLLGWKAELSLEEMIASAWKWEQTLK